MAAAGWGFLCVSEEEIKADCSLSILKKDTATLAEEIVERQCLNGLWVMHVGPTLHSATAGTKQRIVGVLSVLSAAHRAYCHGKAKSRGVETKERQHPKCHPAHYFWPETRGPGQKQCTIQRIGYHLGHRQLLNTKPCDGFRNNGPGGCVERAKKSWAFKALWICLQSLFQFLWHSAFLSMAMLSSINIAHYWYELSFPV